MKAASKLGRSLAFAAALLGSGSIRASAGQHAYAYATEINQDFGVLDLTNGVFTFCGNSGVLLAGLGVAPGGALYSASNEGSQIWAVNPSNGALTAVGDTGGPTLWAFGSTGKGLFGADESGNLYSVSPATGAATLIGPTGHSLLSTTYGLSSGGAQLYLFLSQDIYALDTQTGAATKFGHGTITLGGLVSVRARIYASAYGPPQSVYFINPINGRDTLVAPITFEATPILGLAPTPPHAAGPCPGG